MTLSCCPSRDGPRLGAEAPPSAECARVRLDRPRSLLSEASAPAPSAGSRSLSPRSFPGSSPWHMKGAEEEGLGGLPSAPSSLLHPSPSPPLLAPQQGLSICKF